MDLGSPSLTNKDQKEQCCFNPSDDHTQNDLKEQNIQVDLQLDHDITFHVPIMKVHSFSKPVDFLFKGNDFILELIDPPDHQ